MLEFDHVGLTTTERQPDEYCAELSLNDRWFGA
jgi:hypothetical protein